MLFPASRPAHRLVAAIAFILLACRQAQAGLDFHTYAIDRQVVKARDSAGMPVDSIRITYNLTRLGGTSLEASSITLTSHGSYLAVVEEATLIGNVENRPRDITHDFLLQGTLPIPRLAAVHALSVRHGDTLFRATLRKSRYSLNDVFFDTSALESTLDGRVAFLQQLNDQAFEASFTKLTLGEPIRVRIEYALPFPGAPGTAIRVPVLFHPTSASPRQAHITFFEKAEGLPPVQWMSESGLVTLSSSGTHTVRYQDAFVFRREERPGTIATLQATAFESGPVKGNYLLFKGGLEDSLMDELSRPLEVAFLWRWNLPYAFVEVRDGLKTLSPLGHTVALEARTLKQIIQEMAPRGHRFGLLRSAPGLSEDWFPPSARGTEGYQALLAYLDGFTEEKLYSAYKDWKDDRPAWAVSPWNDSGAVAASRKEFLAALARIRGGFGSDPEALRHIEMIGFGDAPATLLDLQDPEPVEAVIDSVTLANANARWLGVDLVKALRLEANQSLRPLRVESPLAAGLPPLQFPVFQPTSVEYRAFTASRSHAVVLPFRRDAERQAVIKAGAPFDDTLQLQGIDALGRKTRILSLRPRMLRDPADSGLARLWAADPDRIAEDGEVDLGMRYGILTKGTFWGAGVEDAVVRLDDGGSGSGTPVLPRVVHAPAAPSLRLEGGFLRLAGGDLRDAAWSGATLAIHDLRGRLVLSLPVGSHRGAAGFAIPLGLLRRLGQGRWLLVLRGRGRLHTFTLTLGGRA